MSGASGNRSGDIARRNASRSNRTERPRRGRQSNTRRQTANR